MEENKSIIRPDNKIIVPKQEIFLGDQVPRNGGILRAKALDDYGIKNYRYFFQDADSPAVKTGNEKYKLNDGFTNYWGLASRFPFSFFINNYKKLDGNTKNKIGVFLQNTGLEKGLKYLTGPDNDRTFNDTDFWKEFDQELISSERKHLVKIAEYLDIELPNNSEIEFDKFLSDNKKTDGIEVSSTVEYFNNEKINEESIERFGRANFWYILDGKRVSLDRIDKGDESKMEGTIVPKGKILPIVFFERQKILGFTGLGYIDMLKKIRDDKSEGTPLRLLQIEFDWKPNGMEMEDVIREIAGRNKVDFDDEYIKKVAEEWKTRPTSIAFEMLDGNIKNLNPRIDYKEV